MNKLDKFISFRKKIANAYFKKLQNIEELKLPYLNKDRTHSYHLYVLRINFKKINKKKKDLFKIFAKNGIKLQVHYIPIFLQPYFKKNFNINYKSFPNSMNYYDEAFSIPIYYGLKNNVINKVEKILKNFLK